MALNLIVSCYFYSGASENAMGSTVNYSNTSCCCGDYWAGLPAGAFLSVAFVCAVD